MIEDCEMPNEIWAFDNQLEYPRLWERTSEQGGVRYVRAALVPAPVSDARRDAALHELDFNIMRDGDGKIHFKMNQYSLDQFWHRHFETVRTALSTPSRVEGLLDAMKQIKAEQENW